MKTINTWKLVTDLNSIASHVVDIDRQKWEAEGITAGGVSSVQSILEQSPVTALVQTPFGAQELAVIKLGVEEDKGFVVVLTSPVKIPTPFIGLGFIVATICALAGLIIGVSL